MEPITTDLTGGKGADWKRPTKPVIWTDEESTKRFISWAQENHSRWYEATMSLMDSEKLPIMHTDTDYFNHFVGLITQEGCKQTKDSLLHDLNIIKPIGRLEYESRWIDKILSGQKTMDILPVQHTCGYYELWDTERQEVRGGVDVTQVQKILFEDNNILGLLSMRSFPYIQMSKNTYKFCGFDSREAFADHHRTHFQSVKYAITYRVVDMKGDME